MVGRVGLDQESAGAFPAATALVTIAGLALTVVALTVVAVGRSRPGLVTLVATVMLVDVMVSHVPLALLSEGYAPDPVIP